MTSAMSIHIGLNRVDPNAYDGWDGQLTACVNDADCMRTIADNLGYSSTLLLNEEATADRVITEIGRAARSLDQDGILLLTYSGHGGQMPDADGDEDDGQDETWVLYERQLIDDELYNLWNQFGRCRIVVLSDSCHSGSVTRAMEYQALAADPALKRHYRPGAKAGAPARFKAMPAQVAAADYRRRKRFYDALQFAAGARKRSEMEASVLLISGCQDNQLSSDGDVNGLFTANLLAVWGNGDFQGSYRAFHQAILARMPSTQTPNYYTTGRQDDGFEAQEPFAMAAPGSEPQQPGPVQDSGPSIEGPSAVPRAAPPPTFSVHVDSNRYFAVELAAEPELFNSADVGHVRSDTNFYGSWSDTALMQGSQYSLPAAVWQRLRADSERLYYRVLSSRRQDAWDGYEVSSRDGDGEAIPALLIQG
ncbi:caspase family protein [Massilia forsythiae]|uniref:Caspase family protein n=1 Tax=Massilia forsythiae TaxID=2728020 RepID=A0A7Z2VVY2_9BURK|nr:caspase family protein [Massilia forsythiae]QJE00169.1 caspase family protein [Massilia forsythiae]